MGSDPAPGTSLCPLSSSIYKLPRLPHRFEVGDTGLLGSLVDSPYKMGINRRNFNAPLARLDAKHPRRRERMEGSTRAIGFHSRRATRRRHPWAGRWVSQREIRQRRVRLRLPPPPHLSHCYRTFLQDSGLIRTCPETSEAYARYALPSWPDETGQVRPTGS